MSDPTNPTSKPAEPAAQPSSTAPPKVTLEQVLKENIPTREEVLKAIDKGDYQPVHLSKDVMEFYDHTALRELFLIKPPLILVDKHMKGLSAQARFTDEDVGFIAVSPEFLKAPDYVQKGILQHELKHIFEQDGTAEKIMDFRNNDPDNSKSRAVERRADRFGDHELELKMLEYLRDYTKEKFLREHPDFDEDRFNKLDLSSDTYQLNYSFQTRIADLKNFMAGKDTDKIPAGTELMHDMGNTSDLQKPGTSPKATTPPPGKTPSVK